MSAPPAPTLFDHRPRAVQSAVAELSNARAEERGAVFTRREVVDFILDLAGYVPDENLAQRRILEPSFGAGEFIIAAAERLVCSYEKHGGNTAEAYERLAPAIRGVELHKPSFDATARRLLELLRGHHLTEEVGQRLADTWLIRDDFLLAPIEGAFSCVVGNPPYLRQENIPNALLREYRQRYTTIYDRADLYVPFIERSLRLLADKGSLVFICSDRWMKNRYGGPLRRLVADHFHLSAYVDMVGTTAFDGEVTAYPAIFRITRTSGSRTFLARKPRIEREELERLAESMTSRSDKRTSDGCAESVAGIVRGDDPWLLDSPAGVAVLRRLEDRFPLLEEAGCAVGIGVATGADEIFVRPLEELDVEDSRRLPIVGTADIRSGKIEWKGRAVLNPYRDDGSLVPLDDYPRFSAYMERYAGRIKQRHTARANPDRWYKTIDRIYPELTERPKLLIPDIKGAANVVLDDGHFYPHHNLYHVTSEHWDIRALQSVLRSAVAEFVVAMYAVKMRGGFLRYQAQYLRRIRLPYWEDVSRDLRQVLIERAEADRRLCDAAAFELYELSEHEQQVVNELVYEAERASS